MNTSPRIHRGPGREGEGRGQKGVVLSVTLDRTEYAEFSDVAEKA
jgi:hypothetical protein